jgi:hypothetical protein
MSYASLYTKRMRFFDFVAIIFLKALIDISAYYVLAENFQPYTLQLNLNVFKLVESYILILAVSFFLPTDSSRISTIGIWLLFLMSYLPLLTVFAMSDFSREWSYMCSFFWILVCLLLKSLPRVSGFPVLKHRKKILLAIIYSAYISIFIAAIMLLKKSGNEINFNLNDVYEARAQYAEAAGSFDGYIMNIAALVINPILFGLGLVRRKKAFLLLSILSQIILFSVTGFKFYLFSLPLVYFIYFLYEKGWLKISVIANFLSLLAISSLISYFALDDVWLSMLFTNRLLILPAVISCYHYDFFSVNEPIYLSQSILSFTNKSSYTEFSYNIISDIYFSDPESSANTGMLGDAYMNFRLLGLISLAIFLSFILKLADSLSYKKDIRLVAAVFCMPILFLVNATFFGVFFTGGMIFSFVLVYLLPEQKVT